MQHDVRAKIAEELMQMSERMERMRSELTDDGGTDEETRLIAMRFCRMDDDHQAKFFVEFARIMVGWGITRYGVGIEVQADSIGGHLRRCECATEEARDFLRNIVAAMTAQFPAGREGR